MRYPLAATTALLLLAMAPAHAQGIDTVPEARTAAKMALVQELMTTANFRDQLVRTMRETSDRQQKAMLPVPPGFWERFLTRAEQASDTLLAPMVDDYARYFTSADLRALIAFYKSPAGQRMSLVAPVISANSSFHGQQWGQRVGAEVATELSQQGAAPMKDSSKAKPPTKP
jgi:uncharacterized protein